MGELYSQLSHMLFADVYTVSKKLCKLIFCQNFVKFRPIVKIFGTKITKITSFSDDDADDDDDDDDDERMCFNVA